MPPRKIIEYTIYLIDCSKDIKERFNCFYKLYATKYFTQEKTDKDLQRVILVNNTNDESICCINEWSLYDICTLKIFKEELNKSVDLNPRENIENNLIKSIEFVANYFDEDIYAKSSIPIKRIVIISDLTLRETCSATLINDVKTSLEMYEILLFVIGVPNVYIPRINSHIEYEQLIDLKYIAKSDFFSKEQKENFTTLYKITSNNIFVLDYECGIDVLFSYKPKVKSPYPWFATLTIGKDLGFPIMAFKTISNPISVKTIPAPLTKDMSNSKPELAWFDENTHEEVQASDTVKGYYFNNKFVSFTPEQEESIKVKTFAKCLSVFSFVDSREIAKSLYFIPNSMSMIKPDERSSRSSDKRFNLFVAGLRSTNTVALAKRVYNNGYNPNMFCIFPCPEHQNDDSYLLMAQLPYAHQFQEPFLSGQQFKVEIEDPELKAFTYGFLDAMTANSYDNGKPIHPLNEHLKHNKNHLRQYEIFMNGYLDEPLEDPPVLSPDPFLKLRAKEYAKYLMEACAPTNE